MNEIIIINSKYCKINLQDEKVLNKLRRFLSFKKEGIEFTQAYANGWDGVTYLMNKKGMFYFGLLSKVKQWLEEHKIEYYIQDKRTKTPLETPLDIEDNLKKMGITPRDYQIEATEKACSSDNGILRLCTAAGKSIIAGLIAAKLNKPTIIYVIGIDLLQQFHDLFSSLFNEEIGFIGNGTCKIRRINIASIWTIGKSLNCKEIIDDEEGLSEKEPSLVQAAEILSMIKNTKVHIFDESHIVTTNTIKIIFDSIEPEHIYGFSGTPFRDDNTDLLINGILGEQIININASDLIAKGVLAQPFIKFVDVPHASFGRAKYQVVYKEYIVENDERNRLVIEGVKELLSKKYTPLILFKNISHGKTLSNLLINEGIKFEMLDGSDSLERRNEVKKKLENKEIDAILASTIFDIGVNLPILSGLVLAGGGKSSIRILQRIGRILRNYPGKKYCCIVDFFDQAKYLKQHSLKRYKTYCQEPGFNVFKSRGMF